MRESESLHCVALKVSSPSFFLDQMKIPTVEQCRYLGKIISVKNSDLDI